MKLLFIVLTGSITGAVTLIIVLLLVAAIIGYFTAWYYAKSVYTPIIKGLETDKANLIKQVAGLNEDINNLNRKVEELTLIKKDLEGKIKGLEEELEKKIKEISVFKKNEGNNDSLR